MGVHTRVLEATYPNSIIFLGAHDSRTIMALGRTKNHQEAHRNTHDNFLTVVLAYLTVQLGVVCLSPSVRHNLVQTVSEYMSLPSYK
jgi:hypothetical protein